MRVLMDRFVWPALLALAILAVAVIGAQRAAQTGTRLAGELETHAREARRPDTFVRLQPPAPP